MIKKLLEKAETSSKLEKEEIIELLKCTGKEEELLFQSADRVRHQIVGDGIFLRGLIEFSSYCRNNCFYCGLRCENEKAHRFRLTEEEIIFLAERAKACGYHTVVLQAGEDVFFTSERLARIIHAVKNMDLIVTLSIGERSKEEYAQLKNAGADRFLLRIETTDEKLYAKLHPNQNLQERKKALFNLKELGYEVGTGSLVGLPNQSIESLAQDILFYRSIPADMIGIGPLVPNSETPLGTANPGDVYLTFRMLAITRLLLPYANIPATTAMETLLPNARMKALQAGANVIMPNVTFEEAREAYCLYPGKASVKDTPVDMMLLEDSLWGIGRYVLDS